MKTGDHLSLVGGPPSGLALVNLQGLDIRVSATLWRFSLLRHVAATCVPCFFPRETVSGKVWKSSCSFGAVSNALEAWELGNPKRLVFGGEAVVSVAVAVILWAAVTKGRQ